MTLPQFEANLSSTLSLGLIAGRDDPDRHGELWGRCAMLLWELERVGGLRKLVASAERREARGR